MYKCNISKNKPKTYKLMTRQSERLKGLFRPPSKKGLLV